MTLTEKQQAIVFAALRMFLTQKDVRGVSLPDGTWVVATDDDIETTDSYLRDEWRYA